MDRDQDDYCTKEKEKRRRKEEEFRENLGIGIEQKDYEMFKEAIAIDDHNWNLSVIDTEEKFNKFVQMHEYLDKADEIKTELWLDNKLMMGVMRRWNMQM